MLMASLTMSAQLRTGYQTDSVRNAEFREKIAIDMSVPDFETKKIDGKEMMVWPAKNSANVKKADLAIHFKDGIGDNSLVNEMFSNISRYVQMREVMNQ